MDFWKHVVCGGGSAALVYKIYENSPNGAFVVLIGMAVGIFVWWMKLTEED